MSTFWPRRNEIFFVQKDKTKSIGFPFISYQWHGNTWYISLYYWRCDINFKEIEIETAIRSTLNRNKVSRLHRMCIINGRNVFWRAQFVPNTIATPDHIPKVSITNKQTKARMYAWECTCPLWTLHIRYLGSMNHVHWMGLLWCFDWTLASLSFFMYGQSVGKTYRKLKSRADISWQGCECGNHQNHQKNRNRKNRKK